MKPAVQENRVSISQLQNKVIQRRNTEYVRNQKKLRVMLRLQLEILIMIITTSASTGSSE